MFSLLNESPKNKKKGLGKQGWSLPLSEYFYTCTVVPFGGENTVCFPHDMENILNLKIISILTFRKFVWGCDILEQSIKWAFLYLKN